MSLGVAPRVFTSDKGILGLLVRDLWGRLALTAPSRIHIVPVSQSYLKLP